MKNGNATGNIIIGIVSNLNDPGGLGRIQVKFPHLEDLESTWARLATPMAGKDRGMFFRPEKEDEVLVYFEEGDHRRPYILGSVWNKTDTPPTDDGKAEENNWRFIKSRSGHLLKLDDTQGKERVEIIAKDQQRRIVIDVSAQKIQIECDNGDIEVTAPTGNVNVKAQMARVEATNIEAKADASAKFEATNVEMKASAAMTIDGGGMLTLKGGLVKIN